MYEWKLVIQIINEMFMLSCILYTLSLIKLENLTNTAAL